MTVDGAWLAANLWPKRHSSTHELDLNA